MDSIFANSDVGGYAIPSDEHGPSKKFIFPRRAPNREPIDDPYLIAHEWLHAFGGLHHVCEQENIMVNTSDTTITCPPGTKKGPRVNEVPSTSTDKADGDVGVPRGGCKAFSGNANVLVGFCDAAKRRDMGRFRMIFTLKAPAGG